MHSIVYNPPHYCFGSRGYLLSPGIDLKTHFSRIAPEFELCEESKDKLIFTKTKNSAVLPIGVHAALSVRKGTISLPAKGIKKYLPGARYKELCHEFDFLAASQSFGALVNSAAFLLASRKRLAGVRTKKVPDLAEKLAEELELNNSVLEFCLVTSVLQQERSAYSCQPAKV